MRTRTRLERAASVFAIVAPIFGAFLPFAVWSWLTSEPGRELVRSAIIRRVNEAVRGTLAVGAIEPGPDWSVTARGVDLFAPDGTRALSARRAKLMLDPGAMLGGRMALTLVTEGAAVDLSPDAEGTPALLAALAPRVEAEKKQAGPPDFELDLVFADGRLRRGEELDAREIDLAMRARAAGGTTRIVLDGTVRRMPPFEHHVALRSRLTFGRGTSLMQEARIASGSSHASLNDLAWTGDPHETAGHASAWIDPAELTAIAPGIAPAAPIALEVAAGPGRNGLSGVAFAQADGGGRMSLSFELPRREGVDRSRLTGTAVLDDMIPEVWGLASLPAKRVNGIAGFALGPHGRVAAYVDATPIRLEEGLIDQAEFTAVRSGDGTTLLKVRRLAARAADGVWRMREPARVELRESLVTFSPIRLLGPHEQRLTLQGQWPPTASAPLTVDASGLAVHGLPAELFPSIKGAAGFLDVHMRLNDGTVARDLEGTASLSWRQASWQENGPYDVTADAVIDDDRIRVTADATSWRGEKGRIDLDAPLRAPRPTDHVSLTASVENARQAGLREIRAVVSAGLDHGRSWMVAQASAGGETFLRAAGTAEIDWSRLAEEGFAHLVERPPPLGLTIEELRLSSLSAAELSPYPLEGRLSGMIAGGDGELNGHFTATGVQVASLSGADLSIAVRKTAGGAVASVSGRNPGGGSAAFGLDAEFGRSLESLLSGDLSGVRWKLRGGVDGLELRQASGRAAVPAAMRSGPPMSGRIDLTLAAEGKGTSPTGWLYGRTEDLVVEGQRFGTVRITADLDETGLAVSAATRPEAGGRIAALATLSGNPERWTERAPGENGRATGGPPGWRTAPLLLAVVAEKISLEPYSVLVDGVRKMGGRLSVRALLRGSLEEPDPHGRITVEDGMINTYETGRVHSIELVAYGARDKFQIEHLIAHGGRGKLQANAVATNPLGTGEWKLSGVVKARRFGVKGERFTGVVDADADISGRFRRPKLTADIVLASGTVQLPEITGRKDVQPLADHPDFVIYTPEKIEEIKRQEVRSVRGGEAVPKRPLLEADLHVVAPDNFWIKGEDVNVELGADLFVRTGEGRKRAHIEGQVNAIRGQASVLGKKFVLGHGRIAFPGAPVGQGRLEVQAVHVMEDVEKTEIIANVRGTIADPEVGLTSNPPLPEDSVASLLVLGSADPRSRPTGEGPNLAGRAATFVGNYLTRQFRGAVQEIIPVDVLELETGSSGTSAEGRLRVGKYLAPGLFLSYAHAFGATPEEGANQLRLEYRFHKAWYLISEFTDGSRANVDVVWTREY